MICPECGSYLCEYSDGDVKERICWNCGYYESDSQAFKEASYLFRDIIRENSTHFIQKYLVKKSSDDSYHDAESDDKLPKPVQGIYKGGLITQRRRALHSHFNKTQNKLSQVRHLTPSINSSPNTLNY